MNFMQFLKNIPHRMCWNVNLITIVEFLYVFILILTLSSLNPQWFVENGYMENSQLVVLMIALVVALCAKCDKYMFVTMALLVILMLSRETNMGRSYFCKQYLSDDVLCRWDNLKYGFVAEWVRALFCVYIVYYAWSKKIYITLRQYVLSAPIFVWDFVVLFGAAITACIAENPNIDNEILEECCEMLFYLALVNCLWRYSRMKNKQID